MSAFGGKADVKVGIVDIGCNTLAQQEYDRDSDAVDLCFSWRRVGFNSLPSRFYDALSPSPKPGSSFFISLYLYRFA